MPPKVHFDDTEQLSEKVTRQLLYEINNGRYSAQIKLPTEVVMSQQLGVSRNLLRDCLATLEREGFVSRRRGLGTIINRHVTNTRVRMDLEEEFLDMVEGAGYTAKVAFAREAFIPADAGTIKHLNTTRDSTVYNTEKLVTADGKPAIFCRDYVPAALIKNPDFPRDPYKPIFDFLAGACETQVYMDLTEVRPMVADEELAGILQIEVGAPVLFMDEVGYDFYGSPVLNSREYYADGILQHMVIRKKI